MVPRNRNCNLRSRFVNCKNQIERSRNGHQVSHERAKQGEYNMSGQILTLAGGMFLIPMLIMTGIALVGDLPPWLFKIGGWTMAFSMIIASFGVFIAWCEK